MHYDYGLVIIKCRCFNYIVAIGTIIIFFLYDYNSSIKKHILIRIITENDHITYGTAQN